jgi:hypothetical protein
MHSEATLAGLLLLGYRYSTSTGSIYASRCTADVLTMSAIRLMLALLFSRHDILRLHCKIVSAGTAHTLFDTAKRHVAVHTACTTVTDYSSAVAATVT